MKSAGGAAGSLQPQLGGAPLAAYAAALCFGLGDSAFNNNAFAIVAVLYNDSAAAMAGMASGGSAQDGGEGAQRLLEDGSDGGGEGSSKAAPAPAHTTVAGFTYFQLLQNVASCAWYFIALQVPLHDTPGGASGTFMQIYLQAGLLVLALLTFVYVDRKDVAARQRAQVKAEVVVGQWVALA